MVVLVSAVSEFPARLFLLLQVKVTVYRRRWSPRLVGRRGIASLPGLGSLSDLVGHGTESDRGHAFLEAVADALAALTTSGRALAVPSTSTRTGV